MSRDALEEVQQALSQLDDQPLGAHPDILDRVHRELVADLETLSRTAGAPARDPGRDPD
jgi:hypothetical protein